MLDNYFNLFYSVLRNAATSELFYLPVLFCLCTYLVSLVWRMIRGDF